MTDVDRYNVAYAVLEKRHVGLWDLARELRPQSLRCLVHRKRLQDAQPIAFGIDKRNVLADSRDHHRFSQYLAAGLGDLIH
jgi:hypothetical protein